MSDQKQKPKKGSRTGVWEVIETIEDPDSKIGLVLSERIRGKPGHSVQLGHTDDVGWNKYIPVDPPGAKHPVEWIVKSLVDRAKEIVAERKKSG